MTSISACRVWCSAVFVAIVFTQARQLPRHHKAALVEKHRGLDSRQTKFNVGSKFQFRAETARKASAAMNPADLLPWPPWRAWAPQGDDGKSNEDMGFSPPKTDAERTRLVVEHTPWLEFQQQFTAGRGDCPPMFVVVMSKRDAGERRAQIRSMWQDASTRWGRVQAAFGICAGKGEEEVEDAIEIGLNHEKQVFGDLLVMDCKEGYLGGLLTEKTISSMRAFLADGGDFELFMKTDDDTFVSPGRLCDYLWAIGPGDGNFKYSYMGVFAEEDEKISRRNIPCRNPTSAWFEPYSKYKEEFFPLTAKGGPGYVMSKDIVRGIIEKNIAESYVLNNEDRASGVWVKELIKQGWPIEYINLPGTDGYLQFHDRIHRHGVWDMYPYVLHHHLAGQQIQCLHERDTVNDALASIEECLADQHMVLAEQARNVSVARMRHDLTAHEVSLEQRSCLDML